MNRVIRIIIALVGTAVFLGLIALIESFGILTNLNTNFIRAIYIGAGILGFLIFFGAAPRIVRNILRIIDSISGRMEKFPLSDIILGTIGLIVGLLLAGLISNPILQLSLDYVGNFFGVVIAVVIYIIMGLLGIRTALRSKEEILSGISKLREDMIDQEPKTKTRKKLLSKRAKDSDGTSTLDHKNSLAKILDTSVIIDGRIFEVIRAGFLEGPFVVSHYVLDELQHISDSADTLRRERGRKGLDGISELQKYGEVEVIIDNQILEESTEVDSKLLILTQEYEGKIVTNDYNLNKVATVQNIPVLNVNDLANALKPIVIPGEMMEVRIIKEGKEFEQGLGYLDDGTMIVVENGRNHIGQTVLTIVTSVLQTSAGKMIFTRIPD